MPSLAEIRQKYPQYKDLSDQALADGLYRKHYSDMPRAEFDQKVGLKNGSLSAPAAASEAPVAPVAATPSATPATLTPAGLDPNSWWDYVPGVSQARDLMDYAAAGGGWEMPASVTERNAEANAATQTVGALAAGAAPGGGALLPSMMGRIGQNALLGAAEGAAMGQVAGTGALDDMTLAERGQQALGDAALGGALGGAGGYLAELIGGGLPATAGAELAERMGIRATRGQATGNIAALRKEEALRGGDDYAANILRQFDEQQAGDIGRAAERILPGTDAPPAELASSAIGQLGQAKARSSAKVGQAYDDVAKIPGTLAPGELGRLAEQTRALIDDPIGGYSDPAVRDRLMGIVNRFDTVRERAGNAGLSMSQAEGLRKTINREIKDATDPSYRSGLQQIKDTYDDWFKDAVGGPGFDGPDPAGAIATLDKARGEASRHAGTFGSKPGDPAGQMIKKMVADGVGPDEAIGVLFNRGGGALGKRGTSEALNRIERASPEAFNALQRAGWARIVRAPTGGMKDAGQIARSIELAFENNPALMRRLYGDEMAAEMQGLGQAIRAVGIPSDARNASRSGHTIVSAFMNMFPLLGGAVSVGYGYGSGHSAPGLTLAAGLAAPRVKRAIRATRVVKPLPKTRPLAPRMARGAGIGSAGYAAQEEE